MTRTYSKSWIAAYASALALDSRLSGLRALAVAVDEFREAAAETARVSLMVRIYEPNLTYSQVLSGFIAEPPEIPSDLRRLAQSTCDSCCHYQARPPRCQLYKRSISPKQFSCKKYSSKFNRR